MSVIPDRLYHMGGIPVDGGANPIFGKIWFVDATNGTASGDGSSDLPFSTVQLALTAQIANTTSLGDVIYIMPGTYVESITSDMTKVQIIGTTCGGTPEAVTISPSDGNGYTGTLAQSAFRNIRFLGATSAHKTYAAIAVKLGESIIDNCVFAGKSDTATNVGIRIGFETDEEWEYMGWSTISNCLFGAKGGRYNLFDAGICFGNFTGNDNSNTRSFTFSHIVNNRIYANENGIKLGCAAGNTSGGVISHNWIGTQTNSWGIWSSVGPTDTYCMVTDNRITSANDCISGFHAMNVLANVVTQGGVTDVENWYE